MRHFAAAPAALVACMLLLSGHPTCATATILPEAAPPRGSAGGADVLRIVALDQDRPPGEPFTAAVIGAGFSASAFSEPLPPARVFDAVALAAAVSGGGGGAAASGLVPLAQAAHPLGAWLEAVDRAGPLTPLTDPHFRGTVFAPSDEALAAAAPLLGGGAAAADSVEALADMLTSLAAPGCPLRARELRTRSGAQLSPLRLRGASGGELLISPFGRGIAVAVAGGGSAAVAEPDLQSGAAVVHVIGPLPLPLPLPRPHERARGGDAAAAAAAAPGGRRLAYSSALAAVRHPAVGARHFATLVRAAGLEAALQDEAARNTVFAPADEVLEALVPADAWPYLTTLPEGRILAEGLVARHWAPGALLGEPALRARAASGLRVAVAGGGLLHLAMTGGLADAPLAVESAPVNKTTAAAADGSASAAGSGHVGGAAAAGASNAEARPWSPVGAGADEPPLLNGELSLEGVAFRRLDAGLCRRCAVHVIGQPLMDGRLRQRLDAFLAAAAATAAAGPEPAASAAGAVVAAASSAGRQAAAAAAAMTTLAACAAAALLVM